jgi:molybdopterin synthase sulfur carrier subunit
MTVELHYYAWVREHMGCGMERADLPAALTSVGDLLGWLAARNAAGAAAFAQPERIRAAVDGVMASHDASVSGAREIALFPPVTGG